VGHDFPNKLFFKTKKDSKEKGLAKKTRYLINSLLGRRSSLGQNPKRGGEKESNVEHRRREGKKNFKRDSRSAHERGVFPRIEDRFRQRTGKGHDVLWGYRSAQQLGVSRRVEQTKTVGVRARGSVKGVRI